MERNGRTILNTKYLAPASANEVPLSEVGRLSSAEMWWNQSRNGIELRRQAEDEFFELAERSATLPTQRKPSVSAYTLGRMVFRG